MNTFIHKPIITLYLFLLILIPINASDNGSAKVKEMKVTLNTPLESVNYKGQMGVRIDVFGINIKGDNPLFMAQALDSRVKLPLPTDQKNLKITKNSQTIARMSFEFPNNELQKYFGMGEHKVYFRFLITSFRNTNQLFIEGSFIQKQVILVLNDPETVDPFEEDKAANEKILKSEYSWDLLTDGDDEKLLKYADVFLKFYRKFPEGFIKKPGLRGIVFIKNIKWMGYKVGAGFDRNEMTLICDVNNARSSAETIEYALQHEFFHIMENIHYKSKYTNEKNRKKLNPRGFKYPSSGAMKYIASPDADPLAEHPSPGFVSRYATSDMYHGQTETYCFLIIPVKYKRAVAWKDKYIMEKFRQLRLFLAEISDGFTDEYFDALYDSGD
ncbi:MAG: hypothetical protein JW969_19380 [Spirochaetales bacterium]|nr:hypothetical protein [Spirochaetales bacterium]